jgi:hypothetical protein
MDREEQTWGEALRQAVATWLGIIGLAIFLPNMKLFLTEIPQWGLVIWLAVVLVPTGIAAALITYPLWKHKLERH